jgi:hypothetical protein
MTDEHYCELHDWVKLGQASTDTAMLAIVDPCQADNLHRYWHGVYLPDICNPFKRQVRRPQFHEVKVDPRPDYWLGDAVLFETFCDGGYDVEARFCDVYGDGHMSICELRIRVHSHDDDDDDDGPAEPQREEQSR